ncbi:hypothetical protein BGX21_003557 [Mortierella sp. AD011]|nr:hypothetical protein BGX20_004054 [Mortierella sp. AD010]KAF9376187.1 hypothetical protein BGX21_003557 [Mortierella sp. AD011]
MDGLTSNEMLVSSAEPNLVPLKRSRTSKPGKAMTHQPKYLKLKEFLGEVAKCCLDDIHGDDLNDLIYNAVPITPPHPPVQISFDFDQEMLIQLKQPIAPYRILNQDTTFKVDGVDILQKFRRFQEATSQTRYSVDQDIILDLSLGSLFSRWLGLDESILSVGNKSVDLKERWPNPDEILYAVFGAAENPQTFAKMQEVAQNLNMGDL